MGSLKTYVKENEELNKGLDDVQERLGALYIAMLDRQKEILHCDLKDLTVRAKALEEMGKLNEFGSMVSKIQDTVAELHMMLLEERQLRRHERGLLEARIKSLGGKSPIEK